MSEKPAPFIILVTKGILRDRQMRRNVLFWIVVADLALLGIGSVLLDAWLTEHLVAFLLYWGACFWLTLTALLLAVYDMLAIRGEARRERQRIKNQVFGEGDENEKHGDHPL